MAYIEVENLTKDYGHNRGIFNLNFSIEEGEVVGFVGTNGAGKTTTIRHLMGFINSQSGSATIDKLDCWKDSAKIKKFVGYVPGEIAFLDAPTGTEFLKREAELLGLKNMEYADYLIQKLQLDPTANLKRMSKGMKQKTAIVAAFMHNPKLFILDEPTTGLDPLMRREFIEVLHEQKKQGKTILMSSHMFEEVEDICDKVIMIKDGKIIGSKEMDEIRNNPNKQYKIEFLSLENFQSFLQESFEVVKERANHNQVIIQIHDNQINDLFRVLDKYKLKFISEIKYKLSDYFKSLY